MGFIRKKKVLGIIKDNIDRKRSFIEKIKQSDDYPYRKKEEDKYNIEIETLQKLYIEMNILL